MYYKLYALALLGLIVGVETYFEWDMSVTVALLPATVAAGVTILARRSKFS